MKPVAKTVRMRDSVTRLETTETSAKSKNRAKPSEIIVKSIMKQRKNDDKLSKPHETKSKIRQSGNISVDKENSLQSLADNSDAVGTAKYIIEATLVKTAGVISQFTDKVSLEKDKKQKLLASQTANGSKKRPAWNVTTSSDFIGARKKTDVTKLPSAIAQLLKDSSSTTLVSKDKTKKYHSDKLALRQGTQVTSHGSISANMKANNKIPKIIVVSTPLDLSSKRKLDVNIPKNNASNLQSTTSKSKANKQDHIPGKPPDTISKPTKMENVPKKIVKKAGGVCIMAVKKTHKIQMGTEKGVAFILGAKSKHPYCNSFGNMDDFNKDLSPSNRRWVLNIGNFQDNEISFLLHENKLTITGFRQPSVKYHEGQTTSETLNVHSDLNVNNLRVFRSKDAHEFLVLEEIHGNGNNSL